MHDRNYVYIFIREDISKPQHAVQSSHAAIKAAMTYNFASLPEHPYLVVLAVKDESKFHAIKDHLVKHKIGFVSFQESDMDGETTSIATAPVTEKDRHVFRKYQCLKEREFVPVC